MDNIQILWDKTLRFFKEQEEENVDKVYFDTYIAPLSLKKELDGYLYVVTDQWSMEYVDPYVETLNQIYNTVSNRNIKIVLTTELEYSEKYDAPSMSLPELDSHLNEDMTFETFVVGNNNKFAQNACVAVALNPGNAYSPLFIHSNSGLGKTHLLNAIGNYAKKRIPNIRVLYVSCEEFVDHFVSSLQNNKIDEFNNTYRNIDILLIDDIQFIASKNASSEIFFNIFNTLIKNKKQIVLTSDKPPRELKGIEARLVSRFASGLTVSIDQPTFETSKAILQRKLELKNVDFPITEEVLDYMASHFSKDIRDLEGSLNRLLFYKVIYGSTIDVIDLKFALEAFSDSYETTDSEELTVESIKKCVAAYYNLSISQLNSKSRTATITIARHIAMYLVRDMIKDISYIQIGQEFGGRDHSTVLKACEKISDRLNKDANYKQAITEIKSRLQ